jgi:streptogramin lyase
VCRRVRDVRQETGTPALRRRTRGMLWRVVGIWSAVCVLALLWVCGAGATAASARTSKCRGQAATIVVTGRHARGTVHRDVIVVTNPRGARVDAGAGDDVVCGGPGTDRLSGGRGDDRLVGRGSDVLRGGPGRDTFTTKGRHVRTDLALGESLNGRRRTIESTMRVRATTRVRTAGEVRSLRGKPGETQRVVLERGVGAPPIGGSLVIPVSAEHPVGLLGRVTAVRKLRRGKTKVITKPTTLDQAYRKFKISVRGTLADFDTKIRASRSRARAAADLRRAKFTCDVSGSAPRTFDLDMSKFSISAELDARLLDPFISFSVLANPKLDLGFEPSGKIHCESNFKRVYRPAGPLLLSFKPTVTLDASGKLSLHYTWRPFFSYTFQRGRHLDRDDREFRNLGELELTGNARASTRLAVNVEALAGGVPGLGGTIGPHVDGNATARLVPPPPQACLTAAGAVSYGLYAVANVFVRRWTFDLAKGEFLHRQLYDRCVGGPYPPPPPPTEDGPGARDITAGPDGNLWYTEVAGLAIGQITPSGVITEHVVPASSGGLPDGITTGPDHNLWFADNHAIRRLTPGGSFTRFPLASGRPAVKIAAGPDGNLWFTEQPTSGLPAAIGRITPQGTITEFLLSPNRRAFGITAGPDGNIWFTEPEHAIGRLTPGGQITEFPYSGGPTDITVGPGGDLWFNGCGSASTPGRLVGRITTDGAITEYPVGSECFPGIDEAITAGADGNLWITEACGFLDPACRDGIARVTPTGAVTEYPIAHRDGRPSGITTGPDGNVWFTESSRPYIGRITPAGAITEYRMYR